MKMFLKYIIIYHENKIGFAKEMYLNLLTIKELPKTFLTWKYFHVSININSFGIQKSLYENYNQDLKLPTHLANVCLKTYQKSKKCTPPAP